ncbi:GNAT family N-acetyltransferase [Enterococcus saccharolyticus]|uniref:GNAT family N-acetyltransferase n=1 Tax=Enterococcus saccharolyticus TaxID=41997 RepID=UPI001E3FA287|nr:GNAT family protein [Enterococcus saccharolyticus]MCD5003187.1 GNAT family N-acetyltransferase [Enterococcus saccharolyticus]
MITIYTRKLQLTDLDAFIQLRLQALKDTPEAFASNYQREKNFPKEVFIERLQATDTQFTIGGFDNERLVAVAAFIRNNYPRTNHKGLIVAVYCDPDFRGTTIATDVLVKLITEAQQLENLAVLNLSVISTNVRARKFYQKLGFKKYGTEPKALFDGEKYLDEDLLQLDLNEFR